jgi:hypothetical protein
MPSPSTPASRHTPATRIGLAVGGLTVGGGGAGWLVTLAVVHKPSTIAVAAIAATVALAANAGVLIVNTLPAIIAALGNRETARIQAKAEAQTMTMRVQTRTELAKAALKPGNLTPATEMLRLLALDPDMPPDGRRINDEALSRLLAGQKPRITGGKPSNGPSNPGSGPRRPAADGGTVVPLHPDS